MSNQYELGVLKRNYDKSGNGVPVSQFIGTPAQTFITDAVRYIRALEKNKQELETENSKLLAERNEAESEAARYSVQLAELLHEQDDSPKKIPRIPDNEVSVAVSEVYAELGMIRDRLSTLEKYLADPDELYSIPKIVGMMDCLDIQLQALKAQHHTLAKKHCSVCVNESECPILRNHDAHHNCNSFKELGSKE